MRGQCGAEPDRSGAALTGTTGGRAAALGNYLVHSQTGERQIRRMILDDIRDANDAGNAVRAAELKMVLKHFVETHPHHAAQ